ncbi:MAG TPA: DUF5320 domain-containing protein [Phycisphaerae bacterium]|nr:DUF5320 domain-containing protein [Phycisphaerae bacterium]
MTGRAAGYCAGYPVPGFMNPIPGGGFGGMGRGWGRGRGRGRGWGWQAGYGAAAYGPYAGAPYAPAYGPYPGAPYAPAVPPETELDALKTQADYFTKALEEIRQRIDELQAEQKDA